MVLLVLVSPHGWLQFRDVDWSLFCKAVALSGWYPRNAGIAEIPNRCCCSKSFLFCSMVEDWFRVAWVQEALIGVL